MLKLNLEQISQVSGGSGTYRFNDFYRSGEKWCVSYNVGYKTKTKCFLDKERAQEVAFEVFVKARKEFD